MKLEIRFSRFRQGFVIDARRVFDPLHLTMLRHVAEPLDAAGFVFGSFIPCLRSGNPNGIPSASPGLRQRRYPGSRAQSFANPNGVAAFVRIAGMTQPRWGCDP